GETAAAGFVVLVVDVELAVPIEVHGLLDRVQLGRGDESLSETRGDQGAVRPGREAAKRASRELSTGRSHGNEERNGEEGFHGHNRHTRVQRAVFTRLRLERPNLSGRTVGSA